MEQEERVMLWSFGILAWMSVALSSFHTQDQQLAGYGGFDLESCRRMILFGWISTSAFCGIAYIFTKVKLFLYLAIVIFVGGILWVYVLPHPITGGEPAP